MADKNTGKNLINPGFYSPELRSNQAVPWMNGVEHSYPQASLQRALDRNMLLPLPGNDPNLSTRKSNQEMYGGGYTFRMNSSKDQNK